MVLITFPQIGGAFTQGDFSDFNLVFINGVNNTPEEAADSSEQTDLLLLQSSITVFPLYSRVPSSLQALDSIHIKYLKAMRMNFLWINGLQMCK